MKRILLVLLLLIIVIQFIRPGMNRDLSVSEARIENKYPVPADVREILQKACYDCHSNYSHYPWYSKVQPVAWWLDDHIKEGKKELNFSEFGTYPLKKQIGKLKKLAKEVEEGEMPLKSYTWMHRDANLTETEKQALISWAKDLSMRLSGVYVTVEKK
jgi:hypothetical protein